MVSRIWKIKKKNSRWRKENNTTKKVLSPEEYKKKVNELRTKVSSLQKERNTLLETVSKQRTKARNELLKNLNPIIKEYMQEKKLGWLLTKKVYY